MSSPRAMTMRARPIAVAAPPMSFFIRPIDDAGLMSSPPVSKQTPLPTSVTFGASSRPQTRSRSRGASAAAAPTASIIGRFAARSAAAPRVTVTAAPWAAPSATKAASSASGPMSRAGVSMSSWAKARRLGDGGDAGEVDAVGADELGHGRPCPRGSGRTGSRRAASPAPRARVERHPLGGERVATGGQPVGGARRGGSGRAPAPRACPSRAGRRASAPSGAGRHRSSPSPAAKPMAPTQARVASSCRSSQPGRLSGDTRCRGIARGSGAGYSVKANSLWHGAAGPPPTAPTLQGAFGRRKGSPRIANPHPIGEGGH